MFWTQFLSGESIDGPCNGNRAQLIFTGPGLYLWGLLIGTHNRAPKRLPFDRLRPRSQSHIHHPLSRTARGTRTRGGTRAGLDTSSQGRTATPPCTTRARKTNSQRRSICPRAHGQDTRGMNGRPSQESKSRHENEISRRCVASVRVVLAPHMPTDRRNTTVLAILMDTAARRIWLGKHLTAATWKQASGVLSSIWTGLAWIFPLRP
jgi:hypothetical protein